MADPISANPNKCDLFVRVREYQAEKRVGTPSQSINAAPIFTNYCNAEDLRRLTIIPHEKYADHWIGKYITIVLVSAPKPSVNDPIPPDEVDPNMGPSNIQCSEERLSPFVNTDLTRLTRKSILSLSKLAHDYDQRDYTFSDSEAEITSSSSLITNIRDTDSIRSGDVVTFLNNLLGTTSPVVEDLRNDRPAMATLERIYNEINQTRLAYNGGRGFSLEPQMRYVDHSAMHTLCTLETILGHFLGKLNPNVQIEPQNNLGEVNINALHGKSCQYTVKQP